MFCDMQIFYIVIAIFWLFWTMQDNDLKCKQVFKRVVEIKVKVFKWQ